MKVITVTGGIACGKTTLLSALKERGALVIDADAISRALTMDGGMALPDIRRAFGDEVFAGRDSLDRKALGDIVFSHTPSREVLNRIMHPMIEREILRLLSLYEQGGEKLVFLDIPLVYEANMAHLSDEIWCAYLPEGEQLKRLMARSHLTQQQAQARIKSQMPLSQKKQLASKVIDTSGTLSETIEKVVTLYEEALKEIL